ncbi:DUF4446 family protein [Anaeromicrobium sediminis]|uniref:DUF4446 domain-containing protein n=1 Tax=Anaeromicrobium sediminis TaxID=1478221 RepID=A0A267MHU6_9FIRM|nr:DUF4446 family protein [Anaeromicrobium sediminis]PAB58445.1 hypothetical protein CCE28_15160 [Anaeromicrobium sediminis]
MNDIMNLMELNTGALILGLILLNIIMLVFILVQRKGINTLNKRYNKLSDGLDNKSLEEIVSKYYDHIKFLLEENNKKEERLEELSKIIKTCVQNIGIVQYNAYDDVGGNLSFSMALLDGNYNGIIFTSLYGRQNTVTFGKQIKNKEPQTNLSDEEKKALKMAINS